MASQLLRSGLGRRLVSSTRPTCQKPDVSAKYLAQMAPQPTPLSADELRSQEVSDIELPQASVDEKILIKAQMKKRSLRMTFWQLLLVTILSSSTLNVMRQKNEIEEVQENFNKQQRWLKETTEEVKQGTVGYADIKDQVDHWNVRFEALGLPTIELSEEAKKAVRTREKIVEVKEEKLDRFL